MFSLNFRIALSSLSAHKLRAVLAMLGVFLGALAFTGVQHVSKIMVRQSEIETEKLGPNLYAVMAGKVRFTRGGNVRLTGVKRNFLLSDARALINRVPSVIEGTPYIAQTMPLRVGGNGVDAQLIAAWPNYESIRSFRADIGRFFNWKETDERAMVCVLGRKVAERLFGTPEKSVGQLVYAFRAGFRVLGVMQIKGRDISGVDQDEVMLVPLTTYMRRASNQQWVSGVYLHLAKGAGLDEVEGAAKGIMRERHNLDSGQDDDFSALSASDAIKLQRQALQLMTTLGSITSSISFAVGGLGILSIMILVVRSRRVEIGVRRAVGGRRRDIIRQFLFESALLAGVGGGLGILCTVALVLTGCTLADLPVIIDTENLVFTLLGSAALGVLAGAYPAWQASNIAILEVLKS